MYNDDLDVKNESFSIGAMLPSGFPEGDIDDIDYDLFDEYTPDFIIDNLNDF